MKLSKKFVISAVALALAAGAFADEYDDYGYEEETAAEPTVTLGGKVEINARAYVDQEDSDGDKIKPEDWHTEAFPSGKLTASYEGLSSDVSMTLKFDKTSIMDGYWMDILDEFTARAYVGNAQLEAGKMRVVWGKGDKVHVLDNFNANDYTDYIIPDYIDRRISEPMFRAVYSTNSNIKFEAVYTPMMTPDRLASSGIWQPKASKTLTSTVEGMVKEQLATSLATTIGAAADPTSPAYAAACESLFAALQFDANSLYPDTYKIKYGQVGARTTFTVGPVDLGLSYYLGRQKTPTADTSTIANATIAAGMTYEALAASGDAKKQYLASQIAENTATDAYNAVLTPYIAGATLPTLDYEVMQVFGFEGATVLFGRLNSRWEVAYNLTKDIAGDDPWVHNNSLSWVAGFDVDLPIHNININIQNNGKYILNNDKIGDKEFSPYAGTAIDTAFGGALSANVKYSYKEADVDYDPNDCYTNNKLIVNISDTWNHEKIKLDLKGIWGIERGDVLVMPSLSFNIKDDFQLNLSGLYIWCNNHDSEFDGWENNSFAQVGVKYTF